MKLAMPTLPTIIGAVCILAPAVQAGPIINQTYLGLFPATITGTLPNQATALEEAFTLASKSNVTITTTSYVSGGFQPNLLLFNSLGSFGGNFVSAGNPFGAVASTGIVGDSRLTAFNLSPGMYTLALTDFLLNQSITATGLSSGFTDNSGNGTTFIDAGGNTRTGNYAFTISVASTVPEPATLWVAAPLLAWLAVRSRKRLLS